MQSQLLTVFLWELDLFWQRFFFVFYMLVGFVASERWVYLNNGKLFLHYENDGWAFLRKGSQAEDDPVTLKYLKYNLPKLYQDALELLKNDSSSVSRTSFRFY